MSYALQDNEYVRRIHSHTFNRYPVLFAIISTKQNSNVSKSREQYALLCWMCFATIWTVDFLSLQKDELKQNNNKHLWRISLKNTISNHNACCVCPTTAHKGSWHHISRLISLVILHSFFHHNGRLSAIIYRFICFFFDRYLLLVHVYLAITTLMKRKFI